MSETFILLILAILLVLLNGFFVAAEFAIVKLRLTRAEELAELHGVFGKILLSVRSHLDSYLSACQLGITLASLALGWIGEPAFASIVEPVMRAFDVGQDDADLVHGVSLAVAFTVISFLHIVIGELAPKSVAIRHPVRLSLWTATPLFLFYWLMYPFIWVLNGSALLLLRLMGVELAAEGDEVQSSAEIKKALTASHRHGELGGQEAEILTRTLDFAHLAVSDLMMPYSRLVLLDTTAPADETRETIRTHRYSRYPVCEGDRNNLVGLLHIKDWYLAMEDGGTPDLRQLVRPLPKVRHDTSAMKLLRRFRKGLPHFAVVTDDMGDTIGFLTFDLILEALIGGIQDEIPRQTRIWRQMPDQTYEGRGWYSIHSLEELLGHPIEAEDVDTVGGLLMARLDRMLVPGDAIEGDTFSLEVVSTKGPVIDKIRLRMNIRQRIARK